MIGYRVLLERRGGFRVMAKPAAVTRYPNSALFVLHELAPSYQGMAAIKVIEQFWMHPTVPHTTTQRAHDRVSDQTTIYAKKPESGALLSINKDHLIYEHLLRLREELP